MEKQSSSWLNNYSQLFKILERVAAMQPFFFYIRMVYEKCISTNSACNSMANGLQQHFPCFYDGWHLEV